MRVNFYKTEQNFSNGRLNIIKEKSINYSPYKKFDMPEKINDFCRDYLELHKETDEYAYIFCLDNRKRLIGVFNVAHGGGNSVYIDHRMLFVKALMINSYAIIFVHNHPGGYPLPSDEDQKLTEQLWRIAKFLGLSLLDSLIIAGDDFGCYYSMFENGYFKNYKEVNI